MEGSLRVPFIVRWPGRIAPGGTSNEMCHAVDLFTTMASMGGAPLPDDRPIDGVDLVPFLSGTDPNRVERAFCVSSPINSTRSSGATGNCI